MTGLHVDSDGRVRVTRALGLKVATTTAEIMAKIKPFVDAINTNIGKELLRDVYIAMEAQAEKLFSGDVPPGTEEDARLRAELAVYKRILNHWSGRILLYEDALTALRSETGGK